MTKEELLALCLAWDGSNEGFSAIIDAAIRSNLPGLSYKHIADWAEAASATVSRWASGFAHPRPAMKKDVIATLIEKLNDLPPTTG
jgi:hypothetical protein